MKVVQFSTNNNSVYVFVTTAAGSSFVGCFRNGVIELCPVKEFNLIPAGSTQKARAVLQNDKGHYQTKTSEPIIGVPVRSDKPATVEARFVADYAEMMTPVVAEAKAAS